jgi:PAS domain S-box-containing protein
MPARTIDIGRLQQLFDQAPGFMALSSGPDHVFEMVNPSYLALVGPRDLIGRPVREAFPDLDEGFFGLLDHVYGSGEAITGRARPIHIRRGGTGEVEERLLDFVFQPIFDAEGKVSGIFAQGNDVTDLHQAELALRESEARFRLIADSAPVPMWVTKLDRKRGFVNIAYAEFLGVPYDEALDFDWRDRIHPDDAERLVQESLAGEATLKPFVLEARYRRHDGQWRWLRSESQPRRGPTGEHVGFIGVAHDITEAKGAERKLREINDTLEKRVAERTADLTAALDRLQAEVSERLRAEEALRQAQKMEAVGQLTGGIAHDFNNLLTPIMGGLEIIASRATDARMKRIAETALESARRGAKLTSQLLAFSRIQRISMAPVAVNQVIANMMDLLRHSIAQKVRIETRLDPEAAHGICDPNQLENAILNLAINARDAMPDGGMLTISTGKTRIENHGELEPGDYVCISVADTGHGMPAEVMARATEPFFSTKPLGKGTGLGLAQVYGIARQAGGTIRIESETGKGTTVHLILRKALAGADGHAAEALPEAPATAAMPKTDTTVLVIDDDRDVRAFLADSLEGLGYSVVQAEDGAAGLIELRKRKPNLILLDYAMPGMNGAEIARAARQQNAEVPIIFVTGYAETDQLEAALGPNVPVLRKPFSLARLAAAIEEQIAPGKSVPAPS